MKEDKRPNAMKECFRQDSKVVVPVLHVCCRLAFYLDGSETCKSDLPFVSIQMGSAAARTQSRSIL